MLGSEDKTKWDAMQILIKFTVCWRSALYNVIKSVKRGEAVVWAQKQPRPIGASLLDEKKKKIAFPSNRTTNQGKNAYCT